MNRFLIRLILCSGLITLFGCHFYFITRSSQAVAANPNPKYNVIVIASDDLRPTLGCYGNTIVRTPNIDKLASQGMKFDRAYTQYPLCNPSRTSLLTGKYPTQTGVMDNEIYFRALHPEFVSLPQHFKANGYVTLRSGKIFHGGIDDTEAWTEGGEPRNFTGARRPPSDADSAARIAHSDTIVKLEGDGERSEDYRTATRAIQFLEEYKDKPFFLAVGSAKPHSPPSAPKKFFDLYDPRSRCRRILRHTPLRHQVSRRSRSPGEIRISSSGVMRHHLRLAK